MSEPHGISKLPLWGRYRVPWFVTLWKDGKPEFRVIEPERVLEAMRRLLCWICGEPLKARRYGFAIGPMCTVNRVSAEPPQHPACAVYGAILCPFMSDPERGRRASGLPKGVVRDAGMIDRNPGVTAIWVTKRYTIERAASHGYLWRLAQPVHVLWYARGREATREQVRESFESGCPALEALAREEGPDAVADLERMRAIAVRYWPKT